MNTQDQLIKIEMQLAQQDDTIDALNKTVYRQQQKINELENLLLALIERIKEHMNDTGEISAAHEKPPHY